MSADPWCKARAERVVREHIVPLYPQDKPIHEMTPYERGWFRCGLIPLIESALTDAMREQAERDAALRDVLITAIEEVINAYGDKGWAKSAMCQKLGNALAVVKAQALRRTSGRKEIK